MAKETVTQSNRFYCVSTTPDFCKTPVGASTPPLPYTIKGEFKQASAVSSSVKSHSEPVILHNRSYIPSVTGDAPGSAKGIKSGTVGKRVETLAFSGSYGANGTQLVREGDRVWMNDRNTVGQIYERAGQAAKPKQQDLSSQFQQALSQTGQQVKAELDSLSQQINQKTSALGHALTDTGSGILNKIQSGIEQTRNALKPLAQHYQDDISAGMHQFGQDAMATGGKVAIASGAVGVAGLGVAATGVGLPVAAVMETGAAAGGTVAGVVTGVGAVTDSGATVLDQAANWILNGKTPDLVGATKQIGSNLVQGVVTSKLGGLAGKLLPKGTLPAPGKKPESKPAPANPTKPTESSPPPPNRNGSDGAKQKPPDKPPADKPKDDCPKNCAIPGKPLSEAKRAHFATGEEILYQHDFALQGALPLEWVRCYRSGSEAEDWGLLGARWASEFTESLSVSKRGIVWHDATGRAVRLPLLAIGEQFDSASEGLILQRDSDAQFSLTFRDGTQHIHTRGPNRWLPHGHHGVNAMLKPQAPLAVRRYHLTRKQARDGRGYSVEHMHQAEPGQVILRILNDDGRILEAIRGADSIAGQSPVIGQIEQAHPDGSRTCHVRYQYASEPGADGSMDSVLNAGTAENPGPPYQRFAPADHFQAAHPAFITLPPRVNLIGQSNILGHTCQYQYRQHLLTEYRTAGGTTYQIDWVSLAALRERWQGSPLSQQELARHFPIFLNTSYQARVAATRCADGTWPHQIDYLSDDCTKVTEPDGTLWEYHYNHQWLATRVLQFLPGQTRPISHGKRRWSKEGYLLEEIDAEQHRTQYEYDANGNPICQIDANGHTTRTEYNAANLPVAITDAMGHTTRLEYDAMGRVTRHTDPLQRSTRYQYNQQGQLISIVDAKGGISHLEYDASGNLTGHTDCSGNRTRYQYDQHANLIGQTNALGHSTHWQYDPLNRMVALQHPDGTREQFDYDAEHNLLSHTDPQNQRTAYRYNGQNQPILRTDANGHTLHYQYDPALRLQQIINHNGDAYRFTYHPQGWLASETGFDGKTTKYAYDSAGRLKSSDSAGQSTEFLRDASGQLLAKLNADGQVRYAYDALGRLIAVQSPHAENHFRFDAAGQLIEERSQIRIDQQSVLPFPRPLHDAAANHERAFALEHRYDQLGNRIQTILPNGRSIDTLRYGSGHWHGTLWQKNSLIDLERDGLHRETGRAIGHGLHMQRAYDAQSRLAQITFQRTGPHGNQTSRPGQQAQQRQYHYDSSGNLRHINDTRRGTHYYEYDPVGQLLSAVQPDLAETFAFDPAGNLLDPDAARRAHPPLQNQPEPDQAARPAIAKVTHNLLKSFLGETYEYDVQGNTVLKRPIRIPAGSGPVLQSFGYDSENRLTQTSSTHPAKNSQGEYWYDAFNRRIAKRAVFELLDLKTGKLKQRTVETTFFVWDGDVLLQEIDGGSNAKTTTYLMEPNSFVPVAKIESDEVEEIYSSGTVYLPEIVEWQPPLAQWDACAHVRAQADDEGERKHGSLRAQRRQQAEARAGGDLIHYYQVDHLGTPLELVDQYGNSVWEARYKAWGSVLRFDVEQVKQPLRFQGQYWDEESGLHYNRHRYYDPVAARFVTQDPIGLMGGLNSYQYAPNSITWIDPLGLSRFKKSTWGPCKNGTGLSYTAYQQDIDWNLSYKGKTNLQRASEGGAPFLMKNGVPQQIQLHHSRQQSIGPLFEITTSTHRLVSGKGREALHPFGNSKNPDFPVNRPLFDNDRKQYWIDRANIEKQKQNGGC